MANRKITKDTLTYGSIVPLIGGENLGIMKTLDGRLPEWILSYTPFAANDKHFISYLRETKDWKGSYDFVDEKPEGWKPKKKVDVVNTVCPCAGLSSLSTTSSADSAVNEWMYKTAEYVLGTVSPRVFWGENAPRLFSTGGKKVADRLHEIGRKYGYSLNLYFTKSRLHGIPQKRPRTFYFFVKDEQAPLFRYVQRDVIPVENILKMKDKKSDPMNVLVNSENPMDNPWVAYCVEKTGGKTPLDYYNHISESRNFIWAATEDFPGTTLEDVAKWMEEKGFDERFPRRARAMKAKMDDNKGFWGHGVTMPKGVIPSLIGAMPNSIINPFKDRYLTIRDCLRIMGMPDDFNLASENPLREVNHICQNVPVSTASDMMEFVIDYLEGRTDFAGGTYVRQSNANHRHDIDEDCIQSQTADLFSEAESSK